MPVRKFGRKTVPTLRVVQPDQALDPAAPPANLGAAGLSLWTDIIRAYEFGDRASYETLAQACFAADRAERCRAQIDQDGELVRGGNGVREHPLLRTEIASRAFVVRVLAKLGLNLEPLHQGPGRPAGQRGG